MREIKQPRQAFGDPEPRILVGPTRHGHESVPQDVLDQFCRLTSMFCVFNSLAPCLCYITANSFKIEYTGSQRVKSVKKSEALDNRERLFLGAPYAFLNLQVLNSTLLVNFG